MATSVVQTSALFRLPRELRDEIYAHVFTEPQGLRYEYGTARLVGSRPHFFALRRACRQLRAETVDCALRLNGIVFDNLSTRIPRPNFRKYLHRWDTEFSEQSPDAGDDAIRKPISARVLSFLSRTSPPQRALLRCLTIVELRPLDHISALFDLFDECELPPVTLHVVLVPSVIGTHQFETCFVLYVERLLVKRWFSESRHTVRLRLEGFDGLADWIRLEFPTAVNMPVQQLLLRQVRELTRVAEALNALKTPRAKQVALEYVPVGLLR